MKINIGVVVAFSAGIAFGFLFAEFGQSTLNAQAGRHVFMTYQPSGSDSCGAWTLATGTDKQKWQTWVTGFVSGADYAGPKQIQQTDFDGLIASMNLKCGKAPLVSILQAAMSLVSDLGGRPFVLPEK